MKKLSRALLMTSLTLLGISFVGVELIAKFYNGQNSKIHSLEDFLLGPQLFFAAIAMALASLLIRLLSSDAEKELAVEELLEENHNVAATTSEVVNGPSFAPSLQDRQINADELHFMEDASIAEIPAPAIPQIVSQISEKATYAYDAPRMPLQLALPTHQDFSDIQDASDVLRLACTLISRHYENAPCIFFQYSASDRSLMGTHRDPARFFSAVQPRILIPSEIEKTSAAVGTYLSKLAEDVVFLDFCERARNLDQFMAPDGVWNFSVLKGRDGPLGVFAVWTMGTERAEPVWLNLFTDKVALHYENAQLQYRLDQVQETEETTGLLTQHKFISRVKAELSRSRRLQNPLCLVLITFQADSNSVSMMKVAEFIQTLKRSFRETDFVGRLSSQSISVAMLDAPLTEALAKLDRVVQNSQEQFPQFRLKLAVAEYPRHATTAEELLAILQNTNANSGLNMDAKAEIVVAKPRDGFVPAFQPSNG